MLHAYEYAKHKFLQAATHHRLLGIVNAFARTGARTRIKHTTIVRLHLVRTSRKSVDFNSTRHREPPHTLAPTRTRNRILIRSLDPYNIHTSPRWSECGIALYSHTPTHARCRRRCRRVGSRFSGVIVDKTYNKYIFG